MCLSVMIVFWLWILVIYVSVCLWKRKGVLSITDWTFLPLYESTEDVICHFERIWAICLCTWLWSSVVVCCLICWQCVTVWDGKLSLPQTQDTVDFQSHNGGETHKFQVNKDWYIYHSHNPTCTSTCWCWCCSTNTLLKIHPGKLKDDLTTKVWNQNLNAWKLWKFEGFTLCCSTFVSSPREQRNPSLLQSTAPRFLMTFGLGLCYPLSIVELLGCSLRPWTLTNFTNIKTCSDLFYLYFLWYPAGTTREERAGCILVYLCHTSWKEGLELGPNSNENFKWTPHTRSKLVCSKVHNTLSTLVTTYNIHLFSATTVTSLFWWGIRPARLWTGLPFFSEAFLKPVNGCHIKKLSQDLD